MGIFGGMLPLAQRVGRGDDPIARELVGEGYALALAMRSLAERLPGQIMSGAMSEQGASLGKLMGGLLARRLITISWELVGASAGAWDDEDADLGAVAGGYLSRQIAEIGGGTTEMARNVVSERVLGLPRERTLDRDVAFRDVPKGPTGR